MQIFEVFGDIILRDHGTDSQLRNLNNTVNRVQAGMQQFGANIMNIGSNLTQFGTNMWNNVSVPIINVLKDSIMMRSDLTESFNVIDTVFGKSANEVKKWSTTTMDKFGMTRLRTLDYVGSMGAMLEASGLNTKQTKVFSKSLVGLTGDMASFYNLSHEQVWEKIRAGISGETEPLKSLGINMSVANLEAYALSKGINKSWKEMSQAEQVTLRYNYLMDKTKKVQGDFSKTSDSFANRLRLLSGQWDNLKMAIGERLLPIAEKALDLFMKFKAKIENIPGIERFATGLTILGIVLGPIIAGIGILTTIIGGLIAIISAIGAPIAIAVGAISAMIPVWIALTGAVTYVYYKLGILKKIFNGVKNIIMFIAAVIKGDTGPAFDMLRNKFSLSSSKASTLITKLVKARNSLKKVIGVAKDVGKLILDIFSGKKQAVINLLVKKFGLTKKGATNFWKEVVKLKNKFTEFANKVKGYVIVVITKFASAITKAGNFIYKHRAQIITLITTLIKFGSIVLSVASKVVSLGTKAIQAGSKIASGIINGVSRGVSFLLKLRSISISVMSTIKNAISGVISFFSSLAGAIGRVISKISSIKFPSLPSWLPGFATGVTNFRGGVALVGEKGPELVQLPRGSSVIPNNQLQNYAKKLRDKVITPFRGGQPSQITTSQNPIIFNMYNTINYDADVDVIMNKAVDKLKKMRVFQNV